MRFEFARWVDSQSLIVAVLVAFGVALVGSCGGSGDHASDPTANRANADGGDKTTVEVTPLDPMPLIEPPEAAAPSDAGADTDALATDIDASPFEPAKVPLRVVISDEPPYTPGKPKRPPKAKNPKNAEADTKADPKKKPGAKGGKRKKKKLKLELLDDEDDKKKNKPKPHPDPRIVVDVLKTEGELDGNDVQKTVRAKGYGVIRTCYETGLRKKQTLRGTLTFELAIGTSGKGLNVTKRESNIPDESVVWCIIRETMRLPFYKEEAGGTRVMFRVQLGEGDLPVAVYKLHRKSEKIAEALKTKSSAIEDCYRPVVENDPRIGGALVLRIRARLNGEVQSVTEHETHFPSKEVIKCIREALSEVKLPRITRREPVFIYRLQLEAARGDK